MRDSMKPLRQGATCSYIETKKNFVRLQVILIFYINIELRMMFIKYFKLKKNNVLSGDHAKDLLFASGIENY